MSAIHVDKFTKKHVWCPESWHSLQLAPPAAPYITLNATLMLFEAAGAESHLYLNLAGSDQPTVVRTAGQPPVSEGETLQVYVTSDALHPFNSTTGKRTAH